MDMKAGLLELSQHGLQIEELAARRLAQDAQGADEGEATPCGFAAGVGVIEQELIGVNFFCEGDRVAFPGIEVVQRRIGSGMQGVDLQPERSVRDPLPNDVRRVPVLKLVKNDRRNENAIEESREEFRLANEDQVVQWRGIGDDDHADDQLLRERVAGPTIVFEVVLCVMKIDSVLLQEGMYLHLGGVAKEPPQLGGRQPLCAIFLKRQCFQRRTGKIFALAGEVSRDIFREFEGDLHDVILRASRPPCQALLVRAGR
jgi:hypothetical protein